MINVCLFQRKYLCRQVNEAFTELILCRVYICKSPNKRVEVENVLHLLFYILKKEKAKEDVLGGRVPIYDGIDLPVSLFRHNNLKSYPNIFSPNREINFCLRSVGEIATCKSMIPYASNTVRNNNTTQRFATTKCITLNACNTIGDNEATQRRAMPKCIFPNAGNTIRNNNAIQKRVSQFIKIITSFLNGLYIF